MIYPVVCGYKSDKGDRWSYEERFRDKWPSVLPFIKDEQLKQRLQKYYSPVTPKEALTLGLYLALSAPTEDKSKELAEMADSLAQGMPARDIEACKAIALAQYQATGQSPNVTSG